jgi:hypothetical protein
MSTLKLTVTNTWRTSIPVSALVWFIQGRRSGWYRILCNGEQYSISQKTSIGWPQNWTSSHHYHYQQHVYRQSGQWLEGDIKQNIKLCEGGGGGKIYREITWGDKRVFFSRIQNIGFWSLWVIWGENKGFYLNPKLTIHTLRVTK